MSERLALRTAIGSYPHVRALKDGSIKPKGVDLQFVEVAPIAEVFRRMCRSLEFDVAEMSITGYLLAHVYDKGFTALPVFPVRGFPQSHAGIAYHAGSGVKAPRDLEGRSVGARAYTGTASLWVRGVLAHELGVALDGVTWVSAEEEHVLEYQEDAPANAVYQIGADLNRMLREGELAAGIGLQAGESTRPLIADARSAALDYYRRTGIYQINHTVVVRDELLAKHPWLAQSLFDAFGAAKSSWLAGTPDISATAALALPKGDPYPYRVQSNQASLEALAQFAFEQRILPRAFSVQELFPLVLL